jgi:radical SAM-linked protein
MVRHRVRIRFRKEGDLRLIGHHDLARAWERTFRRAQIALRMSAGFHPKPRMVFPSALAMGVIGADEVLEVELAEPRAAEEISSSLRARLPDGLTITSLDALSEDAPRSRVTRVMFEVSVPDERQAEVAERLRSRLAALGSPLAPQAEGGNSPLAPQAEKGANAAARDPLAFVEQIELIAGQLRFTARVTPQGTTRPRELLTWLGLADLDEQGLYLTRTRVELAS